MSSKLEMSENDRFLAFSILEYFKTCIEGEKIPSTKVEALKENIFKVFMEKREKLNLEQEELKMKKAEELKAQGNVKLSEKCYEEAIKLYTEAIGLYPKSAIYFGNSQQGKYDQAIEDCHQALKIDPNYTKAYSRLGLAFLQLHNYEKSVENYKKALSFDPNNENIKNALAQAESKLQTINRNQNESTSE
ncbi:TPR-like protein [Rozella allomycis CSF55]|uniref:TPR-like protein n=1 Tax=Rozella allomycis (strain CSF55) TaxID=988480 RepID=A0A075B0Z6_ROZAC|nr:Tetratricopeptide-like helical domain-containing protein [Rozella allomycis CSF55]RKP19373.1 TPR-like protein [Rozella allomycis CSF55]|eukprot:EPZ36186.1 Tetratricopeptide-like helical domain-containing protein [Rozella allomycis CSF55]